MTWDEFCNASEEEQTAELIGEGIERLDEGFYLSTHEKQLVRNLYKKYCAEHNVIPDPWYLEE